MRKDLEALRQQMRKEEAKEKATFQGLFEKSPGFASEGRVVPERLSKQDVDAGTWSEICNDDIACSVVVYSLQTYYCKIWMMYTIYALCCSTLI